MSKPNRKPILNAYLPRQFRQIRIVLAREPGHPDGDDEVAYIFVAPVDAEGRIDPKLWQGIPRPAGSRGNVRTKQISLAILFTTQAAPGGSTITTTPTCLTTSAIISQTNASSSANMSRSTSAARCTPTG
jgi:hypothetical protein